MDRAWTRMTGYNNRKMNGTMKKIFYFISALMVVLGTVSCANDVVNEEPVVGGQPNTGKKTTIVANTESNGGTRASLSGDDANGYEVLWSEGDEITAKSTDEENQYTFTLAEGASTTQGVFSTDGAIANGDYRLFYCTEGSALSRIQQYQGEGVISNAPMFATMSVTGGNTSPVQFKNLCGLLRLTLKGTYTVRMITVKADEELSGQISVQDNGSIAFPRNSHHDVSLDCGEGVELSPEGTDFFIALPPNTYHEVSITIEDIDGDKCVKTLKSGKTLNIARAMITPASFTVTIDKPLSWDSPEGTRGMLDGRECVVVDYGGNIGKVAIATMNVGAKNEEDAGTLCTWYDAILAQNRGDWGAGWHMPYEREATLSGSRTDDLQNNVATFHFPGASELKFPLAGYYSSYSNDWSDVGSSAISLGTDIIIYWCKETLDKNAIVCFLDVANWWACLQSTIADKAYVRPFHKLPITRNTPVGMVGYIDGKEAMVVELNINGQTKKVAVATRNEGATHINTYVKDSKNQYLDCFGSYLNYTQAQSKCTNGWYIPSIEEWQSLMSGAGVEQDKLQYIGTFGTNDAHRAIVVPVGENSLILPAGGVTSAPNNQIGWQCYYWSSTEEGTNMKCLWSRNENINPTSFSKTTAMSTRLFHAIP